MRIDASGRVGIGIDDPDYTLDVDGDINITGDFMVNGEVLSSTPADDSITYAKMQNFSANGILCRPSGTDGDPSLVILSASRLFGRGSTGNLAAISLGSGITLSGTTLAVDVGTSANKIVQLDGSGKLPAVDGSQLTNTGGLVPLGSFDAASGVIDVTDVLTDDFEWYRLLLVDIDFAGNDNLYMRTSSNNGSSFDSGAGHYRYGFDYFSTTSSGDAVDNAASATGIRMTTQTSGSDSYGASGWVELHNPSNTTRRKRIEYGVSYFDASGDLLLSRGTAARNATSAIDAVRFYGISGNISSGKVLVYGYRSPA